MQSAPPEIILRICALFPLRDLISLSETCHYLLSVIRKYPQLYPFTIDLNGKSMKTIQHVLSIYRFHSVTLTIKGWDIREKTILQTPEILDLGYSTAPDHFLALLDDSSRLKILKVAQCHRFKGYCFLIERTEPFEEVQLHTQFLLQDVFEALGQIGSRKLKLTGILNDLNVQMILSSKQCQELELPDSYNITENAFEIYSPEIITIRGMKVLTQRKKNINNYG